MVINDGIYDHTGWWLTYPFEKYELVSWDDDIPIYEMENKSHLWNHQPVEDA